MDFNDHSNLRGLHAFLSPSNYHWQNYDEAKLKAKFAANGAQVRGTRIHNWAHEAINLGMRQSRNSNHINRYINDGIGYRMKTDFMIFYTENAFGEADTLSFREERGALTLRIHDLKTGINVASLTQLETYAAYFCLEYGLDPEDLVVIAQIYQNHKIIGGRSESTRIRWIMDQTKRADRLIKQYKKEVE